MIIEGLVTTCDPTGRCHAAAMGPIVEEGSADQFVLRPFRDTRTAAYLANHPAGVFHIVDDALVIATVVTGGELPADELAPATAVRGWVWQDACEAWEFVVEREEPGDELRASLFCRVVHAQRLRPFRGFNRARHALLELAIAVTRLHLLPSEEVQSCLAVAERLTAKTGGPREREALELLRSTIHQWNSRPDNKP